MGDILQSLFVILQLFMIFKYSNVIVNRSKRLAKLAFMHCIVSSLCFWMNGIINETRQSLVNHAISYHSGDHFEGKLLCLNVINLDISHLNQQIFRCYEICNMWKAWVWWIGLLQCDSPWWCINFYSSWIKLLYWRSLFLPSRCTKKRNRNPKISIQFRTVHVSNGNWIQHLSW